MTNRKETSDGTREERLRAALRSNLQRRKAQARARSSGTPETDATGGNVPPDTADAPTLLAPNDPPGDEIRLPPRGSENQPASGPEQINETRPHPRPDGDKRQ